MITNPSFGIYFFIKKRKKNKQGKLPIHCRITVNSGVAEISLKRHIEKSLWNKKKQRVIGTDEFARSHNYYIDTIERKLQDAHRKLLDKRVIITAGAIKNTYNGLDEQHHGLMEVFKQHNHDMEHDKEIAYGTFKNYKTTYKFLEEFLKTQKRKDDIYLNQLGYSFLTDFEHFLKKQKTYRKNGEVKLKVSCNQNGAMKHMERFRKVINVAIRNEWITKDPFTKYKLSFTRTNREFLSQEDLNKLEETRLKNPTLETIRDIFVFSCYSGLAYVDVKKLTPQDITNGIDGEKWVNTYREKTNVKCSFPLLPPALKILEKYQDHPVCINTGKLLPLISNQKTNFYLKKIAKECNIKRDISFHIARHTAATFMLTNGVPIETVSNIFGHTSIKTTQIYAKLVPRKISSDMKILKEKMSGAKKKANISVQ